MLFLEHRIKAFPFNVDCVQTDNGFKFTKKFNSNSAKNSPTMFEKKLFSLGIRHKKIRSFTPRHNSKVKQSHRMDNEYFYATHTFYSFEDFKAQLKVHNRKYNSFPMRPLGWKSPSATLFDFLFHGVTHV